MRKRKRLEKHTKKVLKLDDVKIIELECHKCGHKWEPNPDKWRNLNDALGERALSCSRCGNKILVNAEQVRLIWEYNQR